MFRELQTIWQKMSQACTQLLLRTHRKISFLCRRESESSLSKLQNITHFTMQQRSPVAQAEAYTGKSASQKSITLCQFCLEPSSPVILSNISNVIRQSQCSEPIRVPDSLATAFTTPKQQRYSLDYESGVGNELSPTTTSWTLGVNDRSFCPSLTSDELLTDQDRSTFDDNSNHTVPDEQQVADDIDSSDDSFQVVSLGALPENTLYVKEFQHTSGDSQNNVCSCCSTPFSPTLPPRRCHYYGKLYCPQCHISDQAHIPAKIIKSFDMGLYPVCRRAKHILQLNSHQPVIDIPTDNEHLYFQVPILSKIKTLRLQSQHFYAYLSTCTRISEDLNDTFFKLFYGRDYLYQSVHLYSINDLLSLKKVLQTLQHTSQQAKEHIHKCPICREKGFNCEICKNRKTVLYPFDEMKVIAQCQHCSNIYHRKCWENIEHDCPKCYRLIQRRREQSKM